MWVTLICGEEDNIFEYSGHVTYVHSAILQKGDIF